MSNSDEWNKETSNQLRQTLQSAIRGQLRLCRLEHEGILKYCHDVYLVDDCPETDIPAYMQFAQKSLEHAARQFEEEQATWPEVTDCDRLDKVESALRERGILLWQSSPCCDTCTGSELPDRIEVIERRFPGFSEKLRGYTFFIDQNVPESLAESTRLFVYLAYGWFSPNDEDVEKTIYQQKALGIAHEVCDCLRAEGFEVKWNGEISNKIGIMLNWQRRELLV